MKRFILKMIDNYQKNISPNTEKKCRFIPTCSEYAKIAFKRYNIFYAGILTVWRLIRCNPFHKLAYDPVPEEKKYRYKYDTLEDTLIKLYYENLDN